MTENTNSCDCCGRPSKERMWGNRSILGSEDMLCHDCFIWWYEGGVRNKAEIKSLVLSGAKP
jgi:hypothetical protein